MDIIGNLVKIRAIKYEDLEFLRMLMNSPAVEAQTIDTHFPVSESAQRKWYESLDGSDMRCIVEILTTGKPIGYVSVTNIDKHNQCALTGIKMDPFSTYRIKGDMDEVFDLMKDFCFNEMNLHRLEAEVLSDNLLSIKNLTQHGFVQDGVLRGKCYKHGEWKDVVIFSLLREEQ